MTTTDNADHSAEAFRDAEIENLRTWARLSGRDKIEFFEEMILLAYHSGALRPDRLALRDEPVTPLDVKQVPPTSTGSR